MAVDDNLFQLVCPSFQDIIYASTIQAVDIGLCHPFCVHARFDEEIIFYEVCGNLVGATLFPRRVGSRTTKKSLSSSSGTSFGHIRRQQSCHRYFTFSVEGVQVANLSKKKRTLSQSFRDSKRRGDRTRTRESRTRTRSKCDSIHTPRHPSDL